MHQKLIFVETGEPVENDPIRYDLAVEKVFVDFVWQSL